MPHRTPIKVRFYELDPYGHLNHAVCVQFFEAARVGLLEEAGLSLATLRDLGYHLVVAQIRTRFQRPVGLGDVVTIESELLELRRATGRWHQRMLRGDEQCADQDLRVAATDVSGRPVRLPPELAERLHPYLATPEQV